MENLIVCVVCGNNTWLIGLDSISCSACKAIKGDITINKIDDQSEIISAMGIPPTLPNALELAQAQLDRLKKNERVLDKIKDLIDSE